MSYLAEISREGAVFTHRVFTVAVNFLQKVDHCRGRDKHYVIAYYTMFSKDLYLILFATPPPPFPMWTALRKHILEMLFCKSLKRYYLLHVFQQLKSLLSKVNMTNLNTAHKRKGKTRLYYIIRNDFAMTVTTKWELLQALVFIEFTQWPCFHM